MLKAQVPDCVQEEPASNVYGRGETEKQTRQTRSDYDAAKDDWPQS